LCHVHFEHVSSRSSLFWLPFCCGFRIDCWYLTQYSKYRTRNPPSSDISTIPHAAQTCTNGNGKPGNSPAANTNAQYKLIFIQDLGLGEINEKVEFDSHSARLSATSSRREFAPLFDCFQYYFRFLFDHYWQAYRERCRKEAVSRVSKPRIPNRFVTMPIINLCSDLLGAFCASFGVDSSHNHN
jgi:hypothetical protein